MDDGNVLGSMENDECRIDSIAQSWSVISGAGDNDKKYISAENLAVYDGRKPTKHLNCEVDVYCCDDSRVCTLYSLRETVMFLAVILLLLMLILIFGVLLK